jgi:hypothetical protein
MNTMRGLRMAVVSISAAMALALVGQAEKAMAAGQQDPGQQAKQSAELAVIVPDKEAGEGQQAQQKVMLELVASDALVVKGKPYSADTSTETVQTLPDGNRIVHRTVSKFYRDTDGRTRREETFGNVDPEHPTPHEVKVFIDDPVTGTAFVLDPGSKTADKMQRSRKLLDERSADDDGTRMMIKSLNDTEAAEQGAPKRILFNVRDDRSSNPDALSFVISDENREITKEDLGTRNIEGVDCNGTRRTSTIPAGAIGNEKPIAIVTETWFAPAIGAVVESTSDDPRFGKTTYKLANVQLSEPARTLFEPPATFKINTGK